MSDLVIEHDPDAGCSECPFHWHSDVGWTCAARPRRKPRHEEDAPGWCPLRSGPVTVRRALEACS